MSVSISRPLLRYRRQPYCWSLWCNRNRVRIIIFSQIARWNRRYALGVLFFYRFVGFCKAGTTSVSWIINYDVWLFFLISIICLLLFSFIEAIFSSILAEWWDTIWFFRCNSVKIWIKFSIFSKHCFSFYGYEFLAWSWLFIVVNFKLKSLFLMLSH